MVRVDDDTFGLAFRPPYAWGSEPDPAGHMHFDAHHMHVTSVDTTHDQCGHCPCVLVYM